MKISAKGRYALAATIEIAKQSKDEKMVSVLNISNTLGISKIYLEQVFLQLKKGDIIYALKGPKGGYQLTREPHSINVFDILLTVETSLMEKAETTVEARAPAIEAALREMVFDELDSAVEDCLGNITLQDLLDCSEQQQIDQAYMLNM